MLLPECFHFNYPGKEKPLDIFKGNFLIMFFMRKNLFTVQVYIQYVEKQVTLFHLLIFSHRPL